jgi:signal peptidase II
MSRGPGKWTVLVVVFVLLVGFDQAAKFLAVDRLTTAFQVHGDTTLGEKVKGFYQHRHPSPTAPHVVWRPMWAMRYVENEGAAWGLFQSLSERVRNVFFTLVSLSAVAFILVYYRKLRREQRYGQVALALLLSGAVGNFVDRLARGYVIDFIDWYARGWHWPTFNVADSCIVVGVALLLLQPGTRRAAGKAPARELERAAREG